MGTIVQRRPGERRDIRYIHLDIVAVQVSENLALQQTLAFELTAAIAVAPAEETALGLVQAFDDLAHDPVLDRHPGQNLVGRRGVVMTAFIDE